ncbi:MAG: hypothetical protein ACFFAU_18350 [Candidatus Hodarchaeota archaeon]
MTQNSSKIDVLDITIRYLNYNGPLFLRNNVEYDSIKQKSSTIIKAKIGT